MLGCMSAARFKRAVSRMDALPYPLAPWLQACADAGAGSAGAAALSSGESLESLDEPATTAHHLNLRACLPIPKLSSSTKDALGAAVRCPLNGILLISLVASAHANPFIRSAQE